jgi:hypothetical protein
MSSHRETKKNKPYTAAAMEAAIKDVNDEKLRASEAAKIYFVPVSTLKDRLKGVHAGKVGAKTTLKTEEEIALVEWIESWAKMGQPLEKSQVLKVAAKISETHSNNEKKFSDGGNDDVEYEFNVWRFFVMLFSIHWIFFDLK